jgi:hypothetical protein
MSKWAIGRIMLMGPAIGMGTPITSGCRDTGAGGIITASGSTGITGLVDFHLARGLTEKRPGSESALPMVTTTDVPSALLLDNIQLFQVPEPSTLAFALVGTGLLVAARRLTSKRTI